MNGLFNPPHPGETLREDILPALGLTVTQAASQLGVTRTTLSRVINGRAGISPDMARRIEDELLDTHKALVNALLKNATG